MKLDKPHEFINGSYEEFAELAYWPGYCKCGKYVRDEIHGPVVQWTEHHTSKVSGAGPNPARATNNESCF